jgi:hypothetical protein
MSFGSFPAKMPERHDVGLAINPVATEPVQTHRIPGNPYVNHVVIHVPTGSAQTQRMPENPYPSIQLEQEAPLLPTWISQSATSPSRTSSNWACN